MLESGRLESTQLVGFDQTPMVLKDSLLLRVPTDRLRRKFQAPMSRGGFGLPVSREPAYADKRSQDGEAQSESSERRAGCPQRTSGDGIWGARSRRGRSDSYSARD